ncbi:hypothetical protein COS66_01425 [Candidatus Berkelbacteria bacterium CG06_land_8_20_14_3_00_43_10]|uniref:Transcription factor zinc-finger domain-containing protein n=1 Tax=Candidatus Berkelbacteria bacterium CG10_big_fil_rev_8_21_14_0_10_43_14 TaxID=1974515 RepID=A0A2M6R7S0_9BACT|nr:MAG: hypothetical protein AUK41_00595 [Candidatus Berkelbacteria bacterium CG2_30_43_20]PIS06583.1 MAG: hypothetical protein COT79_03950 [Candidatus Berkelbacteria bacterium CG10_big_fil_rev_8_21_14_0_10_43_14]PIU87323.1 MAG: hypothetical protein COS66_01425 [Candidatus Berkelbacteria bacterium CG06_land_8_20_14_3_00_43_10]
MQCPEDSHQLEQTIYSEHGLVSAYECPSCHGDYFTQESVAEDLFQELPVRLIGRDVRCPKDRETMQQKDGYFLCNLCLGVWKPSEAGEPKQRTYAVRMAAEVFTLFVTALGLFGWQTGTLSSSADVVGSATLAPMKITSSVIWFIIFMCIFLIPALVFAESRLAHRPNARRAAIRPFIRAIPVVVIGLMALNIYFFSL